MGVECAPTRDTGDLAGVAGEDVKSIRRRIIELQSEHRELDETVASLALGGAVDQLQLTRMKKRKLLL
ncbi:MAG: YdcH family protein, partial [Gammaproteobacteria bacterium]